LNKIIHLAVRHGALEGFVPQDHFSSAPAKKFSKKKKATAAKKMIPGKKDGPSRNCVNCFKTLGAKEFASHSKLCHPQAGKMIHQVQNVSFHKIKVGC
jgi:hypothetical protein